MARAKRLIVGLGNPGARYAATRHNVGFMVIDALAERLGVEFRRGSAHALLTWGRWRGYAFGLAKPTTYMNRSGTAVRELAAKFDLASNELFIVFDDINLPIGSIRIRERGSAGGHNGLQDIVDELGTDDMPRLRIGIGSDFGRGRQSEYVLSEFSDDEKPTVRDALERASEAALTFVSDGITVAMNRYNRRQ